MLKVKELIMFRTYSLNIEICVEGYELENGIIVQYLGGNWQDQKGNIYTSVSLDGDVIGFEKVSKK